MTRTTALLRRRGALALLLGLTAGSPLSAQEDIFTEADYDKHARRAAPRDAFPVLFDPDMVSAEEADKKLRDDDPVIGIEINGEAKAYPIAIMGSHELANDTCGGKPIAVSW